MLLRGDVRRAEQLAARTDGKLTKNFETAEFKEASASCATCSSAGVFHPKTLNYADINAARLDFVAGKFALYPEGFGQPWQDFWRRGLRNNPPHNFMPLPPFPAVRRRQAAALPRHRVHRHQRAEEGRAGRIKELLRIMDCLASPFGSEEDLLLQYGLQECTTRSMQGQLDVERSEQRGRQLRQLEVPDAAPAGDVRAGHPGFAKAEYEAEHSPDPAGVEDPTLGLYSPTLGGKGPTLNRTMIDGITDYRGRPWPIADYDQMVKDWQTGRRQIRKELLDARPAAQT